MGREKAAWLNSRMATPLEDIVGAARLEGSLQTQANPTRVWEKAEAKENPMKRGLRDRCSM